MTDPIYKPPETNPEKEGDADKWVPNRKPWKRGVIISMTFYPLLMIVFSTFVAKWMGVSSLKLYSNLLPLAVFMAIVIAVTMGVYERWLKQDSFRDALGSIFLWGILHAFLLGVGFLLMGAIYNYF